MKEDLLQYIWSMARYIKEPMFTIDRQQIKVKNTGELNRFAGPDFKEAILSIGNKTWAGHVEVHVFSSDWNRHKHQLDDNYKNVILHVVYEHDAEIIYEDGTKVPVLELKQYISQKQLENYRSLMYNSLAIPCQGVVANVPPIVISNMIDRAMVERLQQKSDFILDAVKNQNGDWNTVFYHSLAENFGFKANGANMLAVAKSIDLTILAKQKEDLLMLEALFFGQAGLLNPKPIDDYEYNLLIQYQFSKHKFSLPQAALVPWKFVKTRPANFPTLRLAQLAMLVHKSSHLFSKILECKKVTDVLKLLNIKNSSYWQSHFKFGVESKTNKIQNLGVASQHLIVINTIVPFLFAYGKFTENQNLLDNAISMLASLPAEKNRIVKSYEQIGFGINNATDSQGVIGLSKYFCLQKRCLDCQIGKTIID